MSANGKQGKLDDDWKAPKEILCRQFDSVQDNEEPNPSLLCKFDVMVLFWTFSSGNNDKLLLRTPF